MQMRKNWTIRLATFGVWLLAAASVVYWTLKFVQGTATPANAAVVSTVAAPAVDGAALARGLGGGISPVTPESAAPAPSINASRFVLTGVVAGKAQSQGIALIAVDGKPARPYRIGGQVTDGVVLQSVENRLAVLASAMDASAGATLELPKQASAIVGTAIPATPAPQPQQPQLPLVPPAPPVVIPPSVSQSVTNAMGVPPAMPSSEANPGAASGQNPARAGAIRGRGGAFGAGNREAPKDDASGPAPLTTQ
jgi:general secretion pathway protein C